MSNPAHIALLQTMGLLQPRREVRHLNQNTEPIITYIYDVPLAHPLRVFFPHLVEHMSIRYEINRHLGQGYAAQAILNTQQDDGIGRRHVPFVTLDVAGGDFSDCHFYEIDFNGVNFANCKFDQSTFVQCNLDTISVKQFEKASFLACDVCALQQAAEKEMLELFALIEIKNVYEEEIRTWTKEHIFQAFWQWCTPRTPYWRPRDLPTEEEAPNGWLFPARLTDSFRDRLGVNQALVAPVAIHERAYLLILSWANNTDLQWSGEIERDELAKAVYVLLRDVAEHQLGVTL